jgi:hypothetical protein
MNIYYRLKERVKIMSSYIKSFMPGAKKKSAKMTEEEKRILFQTTVETLYATN